MPSSVGSSPWPSRVAKPDSISPASTLARGSPRGTNVGSAGSGVEVKTVLTSAGFTPAGRTPRRRPCASGARAIRAGGTPCRRSAPARTRPRASTPRSENSVLRMGQETVGGFRRLLGNERGPSGASALGLAPFSCSRMSSGSSRRTSSETGPGSSSLTSASSVCSGAVTAAVSHHDNTASNDAPFLGTQAAVRPPLRGAKNGV